jgi:hypothetical protein
LCYIRKTKNKLMKTKSMSRLAVVVSCALGSSSFAASVYSSAFINADAGASDRVILGSSGSLLTSGFAGTGYFSTNSDGVILTSSTPDLITSLTSDFVSIGTDNFSSGNNDAFGGAVAGNFVINLGVYSPAPAIGKTLYTFIGNGADLASSTAFVLFKLNQTISADPAPPSLPIDYAFGVNNGTLLFGTSGTYDNYSNDTLGIDAVSVGSYKLVDAVPEPSAALLGAIGALGLLRRRRN